MNDVHSPKSAKVVSYVLGSHFGCFHLYKYVLRIAKWVPNWLAFDPITLSRTWCY